MRLKIEVPLGAVRPDPPPCCRAVLHSALLHSAIPPCNLNTRSNSGPEERGEGERERQQVTRPWAGTSAQTPGHIGGGDQAAFPWATQASGLRQQGGGSCRTAPSGIHYTLRVPPECNTAR
jgi:hypothetical protein